MTRTFIVAGIFGALLWAPWMSQEDVARTAAELFGPFVATCYDAEEHPVFTGVSVRWYPFGRTVHTCRSDYVVYMWGGAEELGGVYKSRSEIDGEPRGVPLSCGVVASKKADRIASAEHIASVYTGEIAERVDTTLFPDAETYRATYRTALEGGATFAGAFAVATWECGASCNRYGIVDVRTGSIVAHDVPFQYGLSYATSSDILVVNPLSSLPKLPEDADAAEQLALIVANTPREYYRMTHDGLSETDYLVRICVESSVIDYAEVLDGNIYGRKNREGG